MLRTSHSQIKGWRGDSWGKQVVKSAAVGCKPGGCGSHFLCQRRVRSLARASLSSYVGGEILCSLVMKCPVMAEEWGRGWRTRSGHGLCSRCMHRWVNTGISSRCEEVKQCFDVLLETIKCHIGSWGQSLWTISLQWQQTLKALCNFCFILFLLNHVSELQPP